MSANQPVRLKLVSFNLNNLGRADNPDEQLYQAKLAYLADVLARLDGDVVAVNEVRAPESLEELAQLLGGYDFRFLGDPGADERPIHTGLLTRLTVTGQGQWHNYPVVLPDKPAAVQELGFQRPIPWLRLELANHERLFVAAVHLKSRRAESDQLPAEVGPRQREILGRALSGTIRLSEAAGLRWLMDKVMDTGMADHYAVMGDFNAGLDSDAIELVAGLGAEPSEELVRNEARRLFPVGWWLDERRRFSYVRNGQPLLLDHILISRLLSLGLVRAGVEGQLLEPVHSRVGQNLGQYPRSDHAPVWAEFCLRSGG